MLPISVMPKGYGVEAFIVQVDGKTTVIDDNYVTATEFFDFAAPLLVVASFAVQAIGAFVVGCEVGRHGVPPA